MHAIRGAGGKTRGQQYPALCQPVPGEEYFFLPAVLVLGGLYDHLSAGAFADIADQHVYDRHTGVLPGAAAE